MTNRPSWRKIEAALEAIARSYDYYLDRPQDTGDLMCEVNGKNEYVELNLTDLAKELEQRL